jgi:hypothetical protein
MELARRVYDTLRRSLRRKWLAYGLRGVSDNDSFGQLDRIYWVRDLLRVNQGDSGASIRMRELAGVWGFRG